MRNREVYLSLARIICALAVITIHTNVCFWEFNLSGCWKTANIIENGLIFAVPIFLMISGATLIDFSEKYSIKEYLKRRIVKIVIPFLFWSIIGWIYTKQTGFGGLSLVYYFLVYLLGVYLAIPVFSFIQKEYRETIIKYVIVITFIINYLIPFLCKITNTSITLNLPFEIAGGYLIYALLGYLLAKNTIPLFSKIICYMLAACGWGMVIVGTYICSIETGYVNDTFRGYTNLPGLFVAVGVFVFLKDIGQKIKNEKIIMCIEFFSKYTFSVYLLHFYVINSLIHKVFVDHHSLWYRLGSPFITFAICVFIAFILKKIPFINKILP